MTRTPSNMLPLGTPLPAFNLLEPATGQYISNADVRGQAVLVAFWCNHCPFVLHILDAFVQLAHECIAQGVAVLAINANDATLYPQDAPDAMIEAVREHRYPFHYVFDESQNTARAFDAACTPEFYLFDSMHRLFYRGQFDAARPNTDVAVTGADLRHAIDQLLRHAPAPTTQLPSLGCNIKWRDA